jgi:hypothetical protein
MAKKIFQAVLIKVRWRVPDIKTAFKLKIN